MPIKKECCELQSGYVTIAMQTVRDKNLTNAQLGLFVRLRGLPPDWSYTEVGLCVAYPGDGTAALRSAMRGLIEKGYVEKKRERGSNGRYKETLLTIREVPEVPCASSPRVE